MTLAFVMSLNLELTLALYKKLVVGAFGCYNNHNSLSVSQLKTGTYQNTWKMV